MSNNQFKRKLTFYIGRFSPLHVGHCEVLRRALMLSEKVLVIVGSDKQPRTPKNPWTAQERGEMIKKWYESEFRPEFGKLVVDYCRNWPYNNLMWLKAIQEKVKAVEPNNDHVWLTGSDRDRTTFYLKELGTIYNLDLVNENRNVSQFLTATSIRELYFGNSFNDKNISPTEFDVLIRSFVPHSTVEFLEEFRKTDAYSYVYQEYFTIKGRRLNMIPPQSGDYERIDHTVDSVVIQSGHILLVRRKNRPGKGLWALPGGYLEPKEWMIDGAVRELREETKLKVPEPVIRGSLRFDQTFEDPDRSQIGRVITRAFCFVLPDQRPDNKVVLPEIYGSDDAEKAQWVPIAEALEMSDKLFDDHHAIIEIFTNRLGQETSPKPQYL